MSVSATAVVEDTSAFARARKTLQELTETAVADREQRPLLAAEMLVPAVVLAQQIAEKLHSYGLDGEPMAVGEGDDARCYIIRTVSWKTGRLGARRRHRAVVLLRRWDHSNHTLRLLWDPRTPDSSYDLEFPPYVNFRELRRGVPYAERNHGLADANALAQWAKDALPLLERVRERERNRTAHLRDGLNASESALDELAL